MRGCTPIQGSPERRLASSRPSMTRLILSFLFVCLFLSSSKDIFFSLLLERERETSVGCLSSRYQPEIEPAAWVCALMGNRSYNPLIFGTTPQPTGHAGQGSTCTLTKTMMPRKEAACGI